MSDNIDLIKQLRKIINELDYKPLYDTFEFLNNDYIEYDDLPRLDEIPKFNTMNVIDSINKHDEKINLTIPKPDNKINLNRISDVKKSNVKYTIDNKDQHKFRVRRMKNLVYLKKQWYRYNIQLSRLHRDLNYTRFTSELVKRDAILDLNVNKLKKNINIINILVKPVTNILIDIDALYSEYDKNDLNTINKRFDNIIIHHDGLNVHMNDVDELSKPEQEIKLKVPELRYKKVPTLPEEPPETNLPIPNELNIDDIKPPVMFNEDIPNYYQEMLNMGYSEDAVDMLEGIPNLDDCKRFIDYYEEQSSNLTGKEKGLFEVRTGKIHQIIATLLMWQELDMFNEYFEEWLEEKGSDFQGAYLTEDGVHLNGQSEKYLDMRDRIMIENRGQKVESMVDQFKDLLKDGNNVEKEVYDAFIDYVADKHDGDDK
ncbi:TPA: hypothetical protein RTW27_002680 [Staphylococcus aureus]|nr:hypothetical protein [Staphylococcus aureus]